MGWKAITIVVVVIVAAASAAVLLWPEDDTSDGAVDDVSLHVREDVRVGDWMDFDYTYPEISDVAVPARLIVVAVDDVGVKVSMEALGTVIGEEYITGGGVRTPAGEEVIDTVYGRTICQKYTEVVDGDALTTWYLDDVFVRAEGVIEGAECIIELTGSSLITPVTEDSEPVGIVDLFHDGTAPGLAADLDVMGHTMGLSVRVDSFPSAQGTITTIYCGLDVRGVEDLGISSVRVETVCEGDLDLIMALPSSDHVYDGHPDMTVTNSSDVEADEYRVEFGGIDGDMHIGGITASYFSGDDGGRIVGTITVETSEGTVRNMFTLTFGAEV